MPKCKICGEAVQSGEVMHVECREKLKEELLVREENIREVENELNLREMEQDVREGFLDFCDAELMETEKKAKRILAINLAIAAFNVAVALILIIAR